MTGNVLSYNNYLTINHRGKGIPYGGLGEIRDDGDANFGFRYAKGNDSLLQQIPELQKDAQLYQLAVAINAAETGLFTIGSTSGAIRDESGYRYSGYIEFAINSQTAVTDAQNYFPIFFHFNRSLQESKCNIRVSYCWELQPAVFIECNNVNGFTCSIFVNTDYSGSQQEADDAWAGSLGLLGHYLRGFPPQQGDFLYPQ